MRPKLTIGMAHHTDFNGAYFTIQDIRLRYRDIAESLEFVVVDNSPTSTDSEMLRGLMRRIPDSKTQYVEFKDEQGTSITRNKVFEVATGEIVLCLDCHVLLKPGAIRSLLSYFRKNPESMDLIQGPLILDDLQSINTHFNDEWRSEMWGTWGAAWSCSYRRGKESCPIFSCFEENGKVVAKELMTKTEYKGCPKCHRPFVNHGWSGHEAVLRAAGYRQVGTNVDDLPFEIPGQGLGLFACRKEAWLGFNQHARGFGGEEMYIHEKYRKAGRKTICLPELQWLHRFGRPAGVPYPLTRWNKVRNYVLEFNELGMSLDPIYNHFVKTGLLSDFAWNALVEDPINATQYVKPVTKEKEDLMHLNIDETYEKVQKIPRDLNFHMPKLKELTEMVDSVTEFSGRRESTVALIAGRPESLRTYNTEVDQLTSQLHAAYLSQGGRLFHTSTNIDNVEAIPATDLLFIDTRHNYETVKRQLDKYGQAVSRFIVLHDTQIYGVKGDDNQKGILYAVSDYMRDNPQWMVIYHTPEQYGLTVLGCRKEDYPASPISLLLPPGFGPGTELKAMLTSIGITSTDSCDCNSKAIQMDIWGVKGCKEQKETIVEWMRQGHERWGWKDRLSAAAKAVTTGLAFKLNPFDPFPSLIDEAIKRAEEKQQVDVQKEFDEVCNTPSDINEHLIILKKYAEECESILEMGVRTGLSTRAFLMAKPKEMISIDLNTPPKELINFATSTGVNWKFEQTSSLTYESKPCDLLFIDTLHNYEQLKEELKRHGQNAKKYIVFHDTATFGYRDEQGNGPGLLQAIEEFIEENTNWTSVLSVKNNNGLMILERY